MLMSKLLFTSWVRNGLQYAWITLITTLTLTLTTSVLKLMLDAPKRRLTILFISLVKCFNKQII